MEFADAVRRRRMVRRFTDRPLDPADRDAVLEAALRAPSAGHTQAVELLVIERPDDFWTLTAPPAGAVGAPTPRSAWLAGLRTAPMLIAILTSEAAYRDRYAEPDKDGASLVAPWWWVDAGMAANQALLAAVDRGLGACFFGLPEAGGAEALVRLGARSDLTPVGLIALGHPAGAGAARGSAARRPRRPGRVLSARPPADG